MEFIRNFSNNHLFAKQICWNEFKPKPLPSSSKVCGGGGGAGAQWPYLGFFRVWGYSFENKSLMCIPLASCSELCHLLNCYGTFTVCSEEPWAWWSGIVGQEDKPLCWPLGCAFHWPHDRGQGLSPELQSQHLKSRGSNTCATHLAGCCEKQIKYFKNASQTVQIYLRNSYEAKPFSSLWVQIWSLFIFIFLINHLRPHLLLLLGGKVPYLLPPPASPSADYPKAGEWNLKAPSVCDTAC